MNWWYGGSETEVEYVIEKVIYFSSRISNLPFKNKE